MMKCRLRLFKILLRNKLGKSQKKQNPKKISSRSDIRKDDDIELIIKRNPKIPARKITLDTGIPLSIVHWIIT